MSDYTTHKIIVDLRWGGGADNGFDGKDLEEVMSGDIVFDRDVVCHFAFASTCEGPDSWRIFIEVGVGVAFVSKGFMGALGKDVYGWSKDNLKKVFTRKRNGDGWAEIQFKDIVIEVAFHPSDDLFADIWLELPDLIEDTDFSRHKRWSVERKILGGFKLVPS